MEENNNIIKKTVLYEEHKLSGAKFFSFAGWEMPLQYTSVKDEHLAVRKKGGLFDVSHMGQIFISGNSAVEFLQTLVPQDLKQTQKGKATYSMLINEDGGIIDDLIIYTLDENKTEFLLIVNAGRIENDYNWLVSQKNNFDVKIDNQSENLAMIAVQGPLATVLMEKLGMEKTFLPARFTIKKTNFDNSEIYIAGTGYTGENGFEIIIPNENTASLWKKLVEKGKELEIFPVGYAARDTLRLEASLLLYGQDMDETTTPVEASLTWTLPGNKEDNYIGKNKILNQMLSKKFPKKLVGFKMLDKSIPRHNYEIYIENENAGWVTSGGISPCISAGIGLGYINTQKTFAEGTKIDIMIRGKLHPAEIVKRPFYSRKKQEKGNYVD